MSEHVLTPLGTVRGGRIEAIDDHWGDVEVTIELADHVPDGALAGLDGFSHLEVIFVFDRASDPGSGESARRPRGRADLPEVGVLAQRHKDRLGRLGLSRCEIVAVGDRHIVVRGLDALDATPVLDVKPWFADFGPRGEVVEPAWVSAITQDYF